MGDLKNIFLVNKFLKRNVLRHVHRLTCLLLSPLSADENAKVTPLIGPHFVSETHAEDIAWKLLCPTKTNKWQVKIKVTADQFVGLDTLPTLEDIRIAREKARIARGVGRGSTGLMFKVTYGENKNICPFLLTSIKSTKPGGKKNKKQRTTTTYHGVIEWSTQQRQVASALVKKYANLDDVYSPLFKTDDEDKHPLPGRKYPKPQWCSLRMVASLHGSWWLNDDTVNFVMDLCNKQDELQVRKSLAQHDETYFETYGTQQKSELKKDADAGCRRVLCTSCHWMQRMKRDGTQAVQTWSGKHIIKKTLGDGTASEKGSEGTTRSIFDLELMVFPIVQNGHWTSIHVDFVRHQILHYNSMATAASKRQARTEMKLVLAYLKQEHKQFKVTTDFPEWELKDLAVTVPQQTDGSACGVFTCAYALFKIMGLPLSFGQSDIPTLRRRLALFIVEQQLPSIELPSVMDNGDVDEVAEVAEE